MGISLKRIFFTLTPLFALWVLVEICLKVVYPHVPSKKSDDYSLNRGHFTQSGWHRNEQSEFSVSLYTNSYGFVDWDWNLQHPPEILLLGDSFVQGAQVPMEKSFGRLIDNQESRLWSMGVPGAGTTTEWLLLQEWLPKFKPQKLVLALLPSNDILNNHPGLESKEDKPFVSIKDWRDTEQITITRVKNVQPWYAQSRLLALIQQKLEAQHIRNDKIERGQGIPIDWHVYNPVQTAEWLEAWAITTQLVVEINKLCKENEIQFFVVLLPSIEETVPSYQKDLQARFPDTETWDFHMAERHTLHMLEVVGLEDTQILNLYPSFRLHPEPETLYYPNDHHWSEKGHAVAAKALSAFLEYP